MKYVLKSASQLPTISDLPEGAAVERSVVQVEINYLSGKLEIGDEFFVLSPNGDALSMYKIVDSRAPTSHKSILSQGIETLELNTRSLNCLKAENIYDVGTLILLTEDEIFRFPNVGRKCIADIKERLAANNLSLRQPQRQSRED